MKEITEMLIMGVQMGEFKAVESTFRNLKQEDRKTALSLLAYALFTAGAANEYYAAVHRTLQLLIKVIY